MTGERTEVIPALWHDTGFFGCLGLHGCIRLQVPLAETFTFPEVYSPGKEWPIAVELHHCEVTLDKCCVTGDSRPVKIRNFAHKGLQRLYERDSRKGVSADIADKLRKMLAYLDNMDDPEELRMLPIWKVHILTGGRKGTWSMSVTANHRLTFRIDMAELAIYDVNLEDYH